MMDMLVEVGYPRPRTMSGAPGGYFFLVDLPGTALGAAAALGGWADFFVGRSGPGELSFRCPPTLNVIKC